MKRDQLLNIGVSEELLKPILDLAGQDLESHKSENAKLKLELEEAKQTIAKTTEDLELAKTDNEKFEQLQNQLADYEAKEKERIQIEKDNEIKSKIIAEIGEKADLFINDITRNEIVNQIKTAIETDSTKGVKAIFNEITDGVDGLFKNPTHAPNMGGVEKVVNNSQLAEIYAGNPFFKGE